jgi:SET and MYND domain-containing protein 4
MSDLFAVPAKKSTFYAKKYLNAGNSKLKKQKYYEALENFNKSLCMAEKNSQDSAFAYAGRSQVYFEIEEYEKCLENIKHAIDGGYSKSELLQRSRMCNRFIESQKSGSSDDVWSFFKLTYPANPKVPFVSNCLKMMNHEIFGRYIITTQSLKAGDIIAIEEPFFKFAENTASHLRCANCLKSNKMNLVPSSLCASSKSRVDLFLCLNVMFSFFLSKACSVLKHVNLSPPKTFIELKFL